jgi:hypothetical protein
MDPLKNWPERYGDAFSEVCEVVRTVEIATRTRSGIAGETYRVELLRNLTSGECGARYEVLADGRWVPVNLGHAGRSKGCRQGPRRCARACGGMRA